MYNAVFGTISKWFPDKPGLIPGILLMGFGFSAFAIGLCDKRELAAKSNI